MVDNDDIRPWVSVGEAAMRVIAKIPLAEPIMTDIETTDLPYHAKAVEIVKEFRSTLIDEAVPEYFPKLVSAIASALEAERLKEREACAKLAKEISEGAEDGYKVNHCEHCRDGEIASHNTGYFIANAIRSRSQP
jgi:hypothetical protein